MVVNVYTKRSSLYAFESDKQVDTTYDSFKDMRQLSNTALIRLEILHCIVTGSPLSRLIEMSPLMMGEPLSAHGRSLWIITPFQGPLFEDIGNSNPKWQFVPTDIILYN